MLTVPRFCFLVLLGILFAGPCISQPITTPRVLSPASEVSQTIGISRITVNYSRPSVRNRKVWGGIVPYGWNVQLIGAGHPAPWRAGANENTTLTISHDARVEGTSVPAGTYGLFFVINADNSGELILSKNNKSWGSFYYDPSEDQLRAKIQVRDHAPTELLTYDFINLSKNSSEITMNWEKKQFPVKIEFAVDEIVMANAMNELRGPTGFHTDGYISAAYYSFENNIDIEQGKKWIDQAISFEPTNFTALRVKARFLIREGKGAEADQLIKEALTRGSENDITNYGYELLGLALHDKAIKVFVLVTERFPKSANAWDSLGEAYAAKGDKENAIKSFRKALSLNPAAGVKANSEKFLAELTK